MPSEMLLCLHACSMLLYMLVMALPAPACLPQVGELDSSLERLKDRAAKLTKSAKKYR